MKRNQDTNVIEEPFVNLTRMMEINIFEIVALFSGVGCPKIVFVPSAKMRAEMVTVAIFTFSYSIPTSIFILFKKVFENHIYKTRNNRNTKTNNQEG